MILREKELVPSRFHPKGVSSLEFEAHPRSKIQQGRIRVRDLLVSILQENLLSMCQSDGNGLGGRDTGNKCEV